MRKYTHYISLAPLHNLYDEGQTVGPIAGCAERRQTVRFARFHIKPLSHNDRLSPYLAGAPRSERPYTAPERAVLGEAARTLGDTTFDVHLNDRAWWRNVPAAV